MSNEKKTLPEGITLRADGRYMARFSYEGERYTFYGKNVKMLAKKMQDKRYELEHGLFGRETDITVDAWFTAWLEEYKANTVKQGTLEAYNQNYLLYIKPEFGVRKLSRIRSEQIQRLLNQLVERYAPATVNLSYIILNGLFKQAVVNRMLLNNPMAGVVRPKAKQHKKIRVLTFDEQRVFIEYAKDSPYYDLYVVALNTGMRLGELRGLMWRDIDFTAKLIHVERTMRYFHGKGTMLDEPKTQSSRRDIPMLDEVYITLKRHRVEQRKRKMLLAEMWKEDFPDLVFTNPWGSHISDTAINQDMKRIEELIRSSGRTFEHIYPHVLRHTFATRGLERGIEPKVMQEILGHTSISMTLDIYSHVLPDTKAKELKKLEGLYGNSYENT